MVFGASNLLMVRPLTMKLATLMYHDESSLTLGAHAQRGTVVGFVCLSVYLSVCICYSQSHFSGVCSSHKGYALLNGQ